MISDEIIKVLDNLCEKIGFTIDWTNENIIPYLNQLLERYIKYEFMISLYWMIIGIALLVFAVILFVRSKDRLSIEDWPEWGAREFVIRIAAIIGIIMALVNVYNAITVSIFPEKLLYEYLRYH